ncbi:MAG: RlmE family RNA methyltransferase [Steroidobacteraceae bacterium]|nr:RlmE family RNA methyltransferase [Nevskiaceae bacterium]MCP5466902.1 RlmE family RNA methyltransferase [Nevskiaceae bacterium]
MARSKSSGRWLQRHLNDPYVKQAQREGYRSRSAYKLIELDQRDRLIRPGMRVMDLGSTPGGWSQVLSRRLGDRGKVLATDILPMEPVAKVDFIQGDFTDETIVGQIHDWLGGAKFDLIVSDIAPNITGIASADQASSIYFLELALDTVRETLKPGATFVAKMFQGAGSDDWIKDLRGSFQKVSIRKPAASRPESREVYVVAKGFKG